MLYLSFFMGPKVPLQPPRRIYWLPLTKYVREIHPALLLTEHTLNTQKIHLLGAGGFRKNE